MHPFAVMYFIAELHCVPFQVIPSPYPRISYFLAIWLFRTKKNAEYEHFCSLFIAIFDGIPPEGGWCGFWSRFWVISKIRRDKTPWSLLTYMITAIPGWMALSVFWIKMHFRCLPINWCRKIPRYCDAAFLVAVEDARTIPELDLALVKPFWRLLRLVVSRPQTVLMLQVWTSFPAEHSDGCGRFLIYNKNMSDRPAGPYVDSREW